MTSKEKSDARPVQRAKLHFIASWFNAVVQERLRYTPIGWSKVYEFNQSDQKCLINMIDESKVFLQNTEIKDKEKYIISHKLETLHQIS